jgi:hypothetical protein
MSVPVNISRFTKLLIDFDTQSSAYIWQWINELKAGFKLNNAPARKKTFFFVF